MPSASHDTINASEKPNNRGRLQRRWLADGDVDDVLALFERVFDKPTNRELWEWKYQPPWAERVYSWVGTENGQTVAHMGAVPLRGMVDGRPVLFFLFGDLMVDPGYRSLSAYLTMTPAGMRNDIEAIHPHSVIYGFTGKRLAAFYRWYSGVGTTVVVDDAKDRIVRVAAAGSSQTAGNFEFHPLGWDSPELDRLWDRIGRHCKFGLVRDGMYLNWRYASHPVFNHDLFGVYRGGEIVGWMVTPRSEESTDGLHAEVRVLDMLIPENLRQEILLEAAVALQAKSLVFWLPARSWPKPLESRDTGWTVMHYCSVPSVSKQFIRQNVYYTLGEADEWWW